MKVRELQALLSTFDPDTEIFTDGPAGPTEIGWAGRRRIYDDEEWGVVELRDDDPPRDGERVGIIID